jgi:hypothetical protein
MLREINMQDRKEDEKIGYSPKIFQPQSQILKKYIQNSFLSLPILIIGSSIVSNDVLFVSITGKNPQCENGAAKETIELNGQKKMLVHLVDYLQQGDDVLSKNRNEMQSASIIILTYNINVRESFDLIQQLTEQLFKVESEIAKKSVICWIGVDSLEINDVVKFDCREIEREEVITFLSKDKYRGITFYELQDGIYSEYHHNDFYEPLVTFSDDHFNFAERSIDKLINHFEEEELKKNKKSCRIL